MAKNAYVVPLVVVTVCAIAGYAAYRLIPRKRTSNGTPASGGAIGGASGQSSDGYYPPAPDPLSSLLNSLLGSLGKGGSSGAPPPGAGGGGLLPASNLNAYNVLYDAQHNLNQDGTPVSYGSAGTTDTLATSINAQIPLEGLGTVNIPGSSVNPLNDPTTESAAPLIDPTIPYESTSSSAGDAFNQWWANFTGNPVNQPDTLPDQSISSSDVGAYTSGPDYTDSNFSEDVGSAGDQFSNYGDVYSGDSQDQVPAGSSDGGSYDSGSSGGDGGGDSGGDNYGGDYGSTDGGGY